MELLDKKKTIDAMCLHYVILVSLAELEQLRRGLAIQKFNSLMLSQKQLGKPLHHQSKKYQVISPGYVHCSIFTYWKQQRVIEESIMMSWVRYLQYVEGEIMSDGDTF